MRSRGKRAEMLARAAELVEWGNSLAYATSSLADGAEFALDLHALTGHLPTVIVPPSIPPDQRYLLDDKTGKGFWL